MLKVVPLLEAFHGKSKNKQGQGLGQWTESDDIKLLEGIEDQEVEDVDEPIDFSPEALGGNERTKEDNANRWNLLLKGLCSIMPGRRFKPSEMARWMIEDIKSSPEKYVQWAVPKAAIAPKKRARTGLNHYIDIHEYYK